MSNCASDIVIKTNKLAKTTTKKNPSRNNNYKMKNCWKIIERTDSTEYQGYI